MVSHVMPTQFEGKWSIPVTGDSDCSHSEIRKFGFRFWPDVLGASPLWPPPLGGLLGLPTFAVFFFFRGFVVFCSNSHHSHILLFNLIPRVLLK